MLLFCVYVLRDIALTLKCITLSHLLIFTSNSKSSRG